MSTVEQQLGREGVPHDAIHQHYTEAQVCHVKNMPEDFFTCKIVVDAPNVYGAVRTTSWGVDIHGPNLVQPHGATNWILDYVGPYKP